MRCFGYNKSGHLICSCPEKNNTAGGSKHSVTKEEDGPIVKSSEVDLAEAVPTATSVVWPVEAGSTSTESVNEGRNTSETSLNGEPELLNGDIENVRGEDVSETEAENKMFKVPTKGKNVEKISSAKCFKKGEVFEEQKESESEG